MKKNFFISYNYRDEAWATWIAWTVEAAGYTSIIQAWDFGVGSNFALKMDEALKQSDRLIAVISPNYFSSNFTPPEWAAVFANDPKGAEGLLVPVKVDEIAIEGLLKPIIHINLIGLIKEAAKDKLLNGLITGRKKPIDEPAFPGGITAATGKKTAEPRFPTELPPIWNIPLSRNSNFAGRQELLKEIKKSLGAKQQTVLVQTIAGLGGIGKTQTALEYAYINSGDYDIIWWMSAENPDSLSAAYASLAQELGYTSSHTNLKDMVDFVRKHLEHTDKKWLLIFDNGENPENINKYIPKAKSGHVG